jgi:hypothetical protein
MSRRALTLAVLAALLTAGAATAYAVQTVWIQPGKCAKVTKMTRVCARAAATKTVAQTTVTQAVTVTAPPPAPAVAFTDGTFRVGVNIQAGTYQATGGPSCYWERLRGFSGTLDDIIANAFAGATIVTISPTDAGFTAKSCGNWTKIG